MFIDAGWLLDQAAEMVTGRGRRDGVRCDHAQLLAGMGALATGHTGLPLLRHYWYEAGRGGSVTEHRSIARLPGVKLRLFEPGPSGRHGAGTLLTLDLLRLAERRAIGCALVIAGDGDLAEGVAEAQALGTVVTVGAVEAPGAGCGQSARLAGECDGRLLIDVDLLRRSVRPRAQPQPGCEWTAPL